MVPRSQGILDWKGYSSVAGGSPDRRQIAQWAGTRTTHPGKAGFETGPPWRGRVRDRPSLERPGSRPVLAQNQGVSPRASRRGFFRSQKGVPGFFGAENMPFLLKTKELRVAIPAGFFRPPKHAPGFFGGQTSPVLAPGTRRPLPGGAHIKSDPTK